MDLLEKKFDSILQTLDEVEIHPIEGKVSQIIGLVVEASGLKGSLGELCSIETIDGKKIGAEIVGFKGNKVLLMPFKEPIGIAPGSRVSLSSKPMTVKVGPELLGRILDGMGNPIDGKGPVKTEHLQPVYNTPPHPLERQRITDVMETGIRSIDGLLTLGRGQRVGIFAGSGVGKSVSLGMISRYTKAEVNVIALIGERGREVREFIERDLGEEGLKRSVVIIVTSDQAAMVRVKGALIATAIAEYFRDCEKDVMFMMDSLTRVAMAQREIGLAVGEPPTTKGYTPSVFSLIPRLLERAGTGKVGSITGLYTVLVEGDDMDDPISDTSRSVLDGHIVLSREIASSGHYPAVDVLESVSRLFTEVASDSHIQKRREIVEMLADYRESQDLISIGAYQEGSNPKVDKAIKYHDKINAFLRQGMNESSSFDSVLASMNSISEA